MGLEGYALILAVVVGVGVLPWRSVDVSRSWSAFVALRELLRPATLERSLQWVGGVLWRLSARLPSSNPSYPRIDPA